MIDDHILRGESLLFRLESAELGKRHRFIDPTNEFGEAIQTVLTESGQILAIVVVGLGSLTEKEIQNHFDKVRAARSDALLVALVDSYSAEEVAAAVRSNLHGVIPSTFNVEVAVAALRFIIAGGRYYPYIQQTGDGAVESHGGVEPQLSTVRSPFLPPCTKTGFAVIHGEAPEAAARPSLTRRQAEVLAAVRMGHSNKVIARMLRISEATVKLHVRQLLRKYNATNRTQIALRVSGVSTHGTSDSISDENLRPKRWTPPQTSL